MAGIEDLINPQPQGGNPDDILSGRVTQADMEAARRVAQGGRQDPTSQLAVLQAISKTLLKNTEYLREMAEVQGALGDHQQRQLDVARERQRLDAEELKRYDDKLKGLKASRVEEDAINKLQKDRASLTDAEVATLARRRQMLAESGGLAGQGFDLSDPKSLEQASVAGRISPELYTRLTGHRPGGEPMSFEERAIGRARGFLTGGPLGYATTALLAGSALFRGTENVESQGIGGVAGSIPIIGGELSRLMNAIPGVSPLTAFGDTTRLGQVTGGGYGEGLHARFQAFRMGLNPFDVISQETATAIVGAVRSQGFKGALGDAYANSLRDAVADLGVDPQVAAGIGQFFVRAGRLGAFRQTIGGMDTLASQTDHSVQDILQTFQQLNEGLQRTAGRGGGSLAGQLTEFVNRFGGRRLTEGEASGIATSIVGSPLLAAMGGSAFPGTQSGVMAAERSLPQLVGMFSDEYNRAIASGDQNSADMFASVFMQLSGVQDYESAAEMLRRGPLAVARGLRSSAQAQGGRDVSGRVRDLIGGASRFFEHPVTRKVGGVLQDDYQGTVGAYVRGMTQAARAAGLSPGEIRQMQADLRGGVGVRVVGTDVTPRESDATRRWEERLMQAGTARGRSDAGRAFQPTINVYIGGRKATGKDTKYSIQYGDALSGQAPMQGGGNAWSAGENYAPSGG